MVDEEAGALGWRASGDDLVISPTLVVTLSPSLSSSLLVECCVKYKPLEMVNHVCEREKLQVIALPHCLMIQSSSNHSIHYFL